jgi:hypothetical protein
MSNTTSFAHQGSIGDTIASIPAMQEYYRKTGKKVVLYLESGVAAFYYQGAVHPTVAADGKTNVMLNDAGINMLIPLFKSQEWCEDCKIWNKEPIHINLGKIRETFVNMPNHSLSKWYFYVYPDLACDLSKQWITVPDSDKDLAKNKIIVTRTERYLNPAINYFFLKKYEKDILFCGTDLEYAIFNLRYNISVGRLLINNFLELAQAIKQCKFHITNQTQAAQISEGQKTPRIVELCSFAPNVDFIGENAFEFYAQEALEYYVDYLWKLSETPKTQTNGL